MARRQRQTPTGDFYREAATKLIDYDPNGPNALPVPQLKMPHAWEFIDKAAESEILDAMASRCLQSQANAIAAPQKAAFRTLNWNCIALALFFRIQGRTRQTCPPDAGVELLQRSVPHRSVQGEAADER